jgi:hypothetical protein
MLTSSVSRFIVGLCASSPSLPNIGREGVRRVPIEAVPATVVAPGGARVGVAGRVLHVAHRHARVEARG